MPVTHAFQSAKADGGDATLVQPSNWNADHLSPSWNIFLNATVSIFTNPGSLLEMAGRRVQVDLGRATQFRVQTNVVIVGATGSTLRIQFSADGGTTWQEFGALADVSLSTASTGFKTTAWLALPAAAKADILLRPVLAGGDGAADPNIGTTVFQFS